MPLELNALEQRVIGCLLEKQISTPDQYPLSLNALVNACNQRSNRDPVLDLDERTVQGVVDGLDAQAAAAREVRVRQPRPEVSAPVLQYAVRVAQVQSAGDRDRLRAAGARAADARRAALARRAARAVSRRHRSRDGTRGAGQPHRRRVRRAAGTRAGTARIEISPSVRWRRPAGDRSARGGCPSHRCRPAWRRAPMLPFSRASRRSRRQSSRCSDSCAPAAPPISNRV